MKLQFTETRHSGETLTWTADSWQDALNKSARQSDGVTGFRVDHASKSELLQQIDDCPESLVGVDDGAPVTEWYDGTTDEYQYCLTANAPSLQAIAIAWIGHDLRSLAWEAGT